MKELSELITLLCCKYTNETNSDESAVEEFVL
jgi:hypothetical protein